MVITLDFDESRFPGTQVRTLVLPTLQAFISFLSFSLLTLSSSINDSSYDVIQQINLRQCSISDTYRWSN